MWKPHNIYFTVSPLAFYYHFETFSSLSENLNLGKYSSFKIANMHITSAHYFIPFHERTLTKYSIHIYYQPL